MKGRIYLSIFIALFSLAFSVAAQADILVDFEDPLLGFHGVKILDPFISEGVRFNAEPYPSSAVLDEVTGLVYNSLTDACVEPKNDNTKLGTGRVNSPLIDAVGRDGFPIKATLIQAITPVKSRGDQVEISVDFQTVVGTEVRMRLYNSAGAEVLEKRATITQSAGACGYIGPDRGTVRITAVTQEDVSFVRFDIPANDLGGIAYVIDNFQVRFVLGSQPQPLPLSDLCAQVDTRNTDGCKLLPIKVEGHGTFSARVDSGHSLYIIEGRDLCNAAGGCDPCRIDQFNCKSYEFIFHDVVDTDLHFNKTFTVSAQDLQGHMIGMAATTPLGDLSLKFTRPTFAGDAPESNFILVLRPTADLPIHYTFRSDVELVVDVPEPLARFDTNNTLRIEDDEFFKMMDQWIAGFIPDQTFFEGLDYWIHQLPINSSAAAGLHALSIFTTQTRNNAIHFAVKGEEIASMNIEIFNSNGKLLASEKSDSGSLTWNARDALGNTLPNGIYFYQIRIVDQGGDVVSSEIKRLLLLR